LGDYVFWEVFKDQFAQISGNFQQIKSYQLSLTKMVLATFWVIFFANSSGHPVMQ
jgi:hypothetical protein